jgi:hypothetical protein
VRDEAGLRGFEHCERAAGTKVKQATAVGGDMLVVTRAEAEKGAELVVASTEPIGGPERLEAPHTSDPAPHAAVVLLDSSIANGKTGPARWPWWSAPRSGSRPRRR